MRTTIYGHSGSYNHGNEAVVRGLSVVLGEKLPLYCTDPYIDRVFGLNDAVSLLSEGEECTNIIKRNAKRVLSKLMHSDKPFFRDKYKNLLKNIDGLYLFTAEDQYCESKRIVDWFEFQNRMINMGGGV